MPKTVDKRAEARRQAKIQAAHANPVSERPVVRSSTSPIRGGARKKQRGFLSRYPWATTFVVVLALGLGTLYLYSNKLWVFAPPPPVQAKCDLKTHHCNKAPIMTINVNKTYIATIETAKGNIVIQLDAKHAPLAVNNFVFLAQQHFYNGLYFWRVEVPGQPSVLDGQPSTLSLIQGATVNKTGQDPATIPGYTFNDEPVVGDYVAGAVAMARTQAANSNGAQFFICTGDDTKQLAKSYIIFGKVTSGLDVAKQIKADDIITTVTIQVQ